MSRRSGGAAAALVLASALVVGSCSSSGDGGQATRPSTTVVVDRPAGPAADLSQELTGGNGVFIGEATPAIDLAANGYVQHEYVAAGTATSYTSPTPQPADGRFTVTEGPTADYRTRVLVRRPEDPARFNGTVVVEWLNVSGGVDAGPDWTFTAEELAREGAAWVGVSAQLIGVEGGPVAVGVDSDLAGKGIKAIDPARYGTLTHPGDAFSYDIYTQVARGLREGDAMGGLPVERVLGVGESQSAFALTTYANAVQPLAGAYDGFLIHSRGGAAMPLGEAGKPISIADAIALPPVQTRADLAVPVLTLVTETDVTSVIGYYPARQDDTDRFRLWEVAGTAHADRTLLGDRADSVGCGVAVNDGPQRFAVRAALHALDAWVRDGEAPPEAPRLQVDTSSGRPTIVRDTDANALGGIRYPQVAVPVATLSGEKGPSSSTICLLLGSTIPFAPERLAQLYPSADAYEQAYAAATDEVVTAGFAVEGDRPEILADAQPSVIPSRSGG